MKTIRVAVIGASGYSGEELIRLLLRHPQATLGLVTSRKYAGEPLGRVFPRFAESGLRFEAPDVSRVAAEADVAFLALPHGLAAEYARPLIRAGLVVIDLSADFRLRSLETYERFYKKHEAPELLAEAVYGLVEFYREEIAGAQLIACPGCYPTSVEIPLVPLLKQGLISPEGIAVVSMSGVSGAGRKVDLAYIFPECNESVRPYKPSGHRHTPEIEQELARAAGLDPGELRISFVPHLVPVNRGIHSTILARPAPGVTLDGILAAWRSAYDGAPFVRVLEPPGLADTKHVTLTNMVEIGAAWDAPAGRVILSSAIDNLTKGASGQAVQCLNVRFGFAETAGLV